jgi:hypothetical protein
MYTPACNNLILVWRVIWVTLKAVASSSSTLTRKTSLTQDKIKDETEDEITPATAFNPKALFDARVLVGIIPTKL